MKQLKDIVLTGFLALLAFTACTEEKLIDERPMETGTVSISFSTEGRGDESDKCRWYLSVRYGG